MRGLIEYKLNPLVRCCGLLYVRLASDVNYLWLWFKKYLLDDEGKQRF